MNNYRDAVKDRCHITANYRRAEQIALNLKLHLNLKTGPISMFFHKMQGYDGHLLSSQWLGCREKSNASRTTQRNISPFDMET